MLPDADSPFGRRVRERLDTERVIWLTTVGADGTPQPNPVWFLWADGGFLIYNRPDAKRLDHVLDRPQAALHFNSDDGGGDITVFRGLARPIDTQPAAHENPAYLAKYGDAMQRISGSVEKFGETYSRVLQVRVNGVRGF
ncbi:hypothetical protein GCM10027445_61340 [Amycolatopsis endophytica]